MEQNNPRFPQQDQSNKIHGDEDAQKEKYIRDAGKIEDLPSQEQASEMGAKTKKSDKNESSHLTDRSGEERKEDYINTDERKRDLDRRGL